MPGYSCKLREIGLLTQNSTTLPAPQWRNISSAMTQRGRSPLGYNSPRKSTLYERKSGSRYLAHLMKPARLRAPLEPHMMPLDFRIIQTLQKAAPTQKTSKAVR